MNDDKDKVLDKSLLGFVVDTNTEDKNSDEEIKNQQYLTTLLFELYPELNKTKE
tara:strand:- start:460 stop:621 length:162 start_codon:yes stop_codon:yes gene_type:complete